MEKAIPIRADRGGLRDVPARLRQPAALVTLGLLTAVLVVGGAVVLGDEDPERTSTRGPGAPPQAFTATSWWNMPLPNDPPLNPAGAEILEYLRTAPQSGAGCLMLAGAGDSPWGQPVYQSGPGDSEYDVTGIPGDPPPELTTLRIPDGARPADNGDGSMTVYDESRGYVVALTDAVWDEVGDQWSASGASVTYLDSNGLDARTGRSDDSRNRGTHRGNNGATMAVTWGEVRAGNIDHVLKVASGPEVSRRHVFPMVGSDGDYAGDDPSVPPQGLRFRIKPSLDLTALGLRADALVIARALQRYGFYIGDSSGTTAVKLENTRAEGYGQLWRLPPDALCDLPFTQDNWDVLAEGYHPGVE
jgi:hypothetical protein